ncbi:MAG TPA: DPP IV N-terminal domain-containing protein, partial [bacterium]|nr:DPP IV N-terminal domain-containing protein [bacterium]
MRVRASRVQGIVAASLAILGFAVAPATAQITETVLTGAGTDARPAWSADGTTILFDSFRSGNPDIWSIPATGGTLTRLTFSRNSDMAPCFSPDGSEYAFAAVQGGGAPNIWKRPSAGGQATLLHNDPGVTDGLPDWSPDGTQVAYVKGSDIYVVSSAGGTPVQLTFGGGNNTHPSWSPDGTQIAYQSSAGGNIDVYVMPAAGGTPTRLTFDPAPDGAPDWSPDGTQIAYQSQVFGNNDIFIMPAGGGAATAITTGPGNDQHPDWSPDGSSIVFARNGGLVIAQIAPVSPTGADLGLTKTVDNPTPAIDGTVTYTLSLTNFGPNPATGVEVTDLLPSDVAYVTSVASQGSYVDGTGLWTVGSLGVNVTATLDITADIAAGGNVTIVNSASVTASDSTDTNSANDFG